MREEAEQLIAEASSLAHKEGTSDVVRRLQVITPHP